jgi:hypothetical protein
MVLKDFTWLVSVGDTYRKDVQYDEIIEGLSWVCSLFLRPFKRFIIFLLECVFFVLCN